MPGSQKTRAQTSRRLSAISPAAAGIAVEATAHVVGVPGDRDNRPVRTFRTFRIRGDPPQLADCLTAVGITTVALESTGVSWVPVFEILDARGFEACW